MNNQAVTVYPSDFVPQDIVHENIRVTGIVQGVGFRPAVWRMANDAGLAGSVLNDGQGVLIRVQGTIDVIDGFLQRLSSEAPPLARIDKVKREASQQTVVPAGFTIESSTNTSITTQISPDAATCAECMADAHDPFGRRFRYPLTNCTHCGPRFSIIEAIPYDRGGTSMKSFVQCPVCQGEYDSPADRRFHAQPNACHVCGPQVSLARIDGHQFCLETISLLDAVDAACTLLQNGEILAIKGIGGFHLACDATNPEVVEKLRQKKQRFAKPFALMARDPEVIARYTQLSELEKQLLSSAEAPIVLLQKSTLPPEGKKREFGVAEGRREQDLRPIAASIASGQSSLGFMLPYTPLHKLMLKRMNRPIVLTSANRSDEPQVIANAEVNKRLGDMATYVLWHDRDIVNRVDDSVVRVVLDKPRMLRRARGYTPAPLPLPPGFAAAPEILAMGAELKNTFCLIKQGNAILSQHIGDLENAETYADYCKNLQLYQQLYQHQPTIIAVDHHPEYLSGKLGRSHADEHQLELVEIQHHHAHIAACLADNQYPLHAGPVLGVALDGLGFGEQGELWGGEFLRADYVQAERLGTFKPVAMPGGSQAMHEPWRNTYAHLMAEMGWPTCKMNFGELELISFLEQKPLDTLSAMLTQGLNAPLASSCGRLFDAVAAAMGICREQALYEGQAAIELETMVDQHTLLHEDEQLAYPFAIPNLSGTGGLPYIEPLAMWQAVLGDLILQTPPAVMSARFHKGLAKIIVKMVEKLTTQYDERIINTVALSGGVFQNKTLLEQVVIRLEALQYKVFIHQHIPANDGGLALGQAMIAAAQSIRRNKRCV